jgi:hypothetical protein
LTSTQDYWGVDGDTVVFVADPNTGNILNFNVGENVDLAVPRVGTTTPESAPDPNDNHHAFVVVDLDAVFISLPLLFMNRILPQVPGD